MLYVAQSRVELCGEASYFFNKYVMFDRWHWSLHQKPNTWLVMAAQGSEVADWIGSHTAFGVMDDFGNLVKVA